MYTNLCTGTDEQWTDVECCATLIGRNPFLIETYHLFDHFGEEFGGKFGHENTATSALQTLGIVLHTEDAYLSVWTAVSLQTFKGLLSVVQTGGSHV